MKNIYTDIKQLANIILTKQFNFFSITPASRRMVAKFKGNLFKLCFHGVIESSDKSGVNPVWCSMPSLSAVLCLKYVNNTVGLPALTKFFSNKAIVNQSFFSVNNFLRRTSNSVQIYLNNQ